MRPTCWLFVLSCLTACGTSTHASRLDSRTAVRRDAGVASPLLQERMQALSALLAENGYRPGGALLFGFLPNGDRRTERLVLPARTCLTLVAMASAAMVDLDAGLYTLEGEPLAEDDNTDARPALSLCTGEEARQVYYTVHAYQGWGAYVMQSFVRGQQPGDRGLSSHDDPEQAGRLNLLQSLRSRGFEQDGPEMKLSLTGPTALRVALPARVGSCYTFVARVEGELRDATLTAINLEGKELARGVAEAGTIALQLCAQRSAELALLVQARRGQGSVALLRFIATEERVGGPRTLWLGEPPP